MAKSWSFIENPFLNKTKRSYRKMKKLGEYTLAALLPHNGNAFFDGLIASLQPLVNAYNAAYNAWLVSRGAQKGKTMTVDELLKDLSGELIRRWDVAIQGVYPQNTPQYITLLPNRRTPFQNGSKQQRKAAVLALSTAIGADAALTSVKTQVDDFYEDLHDADTEQQGSLSTTGGNSDEVELARIELGIGMYGVMALLMNNYKETPEQVENFFDLETLRSKEQELFTGEIAPSATELVFTRTLAPTDSIRLQNLGETPLRFALLPEENDSIGAVYIEVAAGEEETVTAAQLGTVPGNRFLKVKNMSDIAGGAWEVEMV